MTQAAFVRPVPCNLPIVILSLLIPQGQLELSICLLKVNCLRTYEAYVFSRSSEFTTCAGLSPAHLKSLSSALMKE